MYQNSEDLRNEDTGKKGHEEMWAKHFSTWDTCQSSTESRKLNRAFISLQGQEERNQFQILPWWKGHGKCAGLSDVTNYVPGVMMLQKGWALTTEAELQGSSLPDRNRLQIPLENLVIIQSHGFFYLFYIQKLTFSKKFIATLWVKFKLLTKRKNKRW